jgi:hypothetical protein
MFEATAFLNAQAARFYQLKVYTIENEFQEQQMDGYLKEAYLPAMHRAGISHIGVFKPNAGEATAGKRIYVLLPLNSLEQFEKLPELLSSDKQYQADGSKTINAPYDNPPYKRIESILMKAFKEMPETGIPRHSTPPAERVYELRSYLGATEKIFQNKVEMFNEGGEIRLFKELDFNPVFYGEVISGATMPNLMYMTTFSNEASQKEHWNAFGSHPSWNAMKDNPKYQNNVSAIERFLLHPTDYSDL